MKRKNRIAGILALAASTALLVSGCATGAESGSGGDVTMTFWQNSTTGEGKAYWEKTIDEFEAAYPKVTIEMQSVQNEEMDGKLQTALNSGDAPDIFLARGGGKLADIVAAGQAMDITDSISDATKAAVPEGVLSAFAIDGKIYGMTTAVLPGGIFYSKDLFAEAGIDAVPTTLDELDAAVEKLKDAGIAPIAVGAKDAWPAAHWYYFFAVRACSQDVMNEAAATMKFDDACWLEASENLEGFVQTEPFNEGFLTTSAQQGAGSSAGLLANHEAAMELMGAWNPGVIASLTPDEKPLPDLGWFPFPEVSGGDGGAGALMGGVDGFTCSADAPKQECTDFLNFFMQQEQQEGYANAYHTIPANTDAQAVVTDTTLQTILGAYNEAPYVTVWLDTLFGQNVGTALNTGVVDLLAGQGSAADIISGVNAAAAKG